MLLLSQAGLVAAYVLVAALLLVLCIYTRWSWRIKTLMVVVVSSFYLVSYYSIPPLLGWPARTELPKRFNLVAIYVEEPDKATGAAGEIYLWATDLAAGPGRPRPRAYNVPYTAELHTKVVEAGNKMRKGLPQLGEVNDEPLGTEVQPTDETQGGQESVSIEFFDMPDPLFPEK